MHYYTPSIVEESYNYELLPARGDNDPVLHTTRSFTLQAEHVYAACLREPFAGEVYDQMYAQCEAWENNGPAYLL